MASARIITHHTHLNPPANPPRLSPSLSFLYGMRVGMVGLLLRISPYGAGRVCVRGERLTRVFSPKRLISPDLTHQTHPWPYPLAWHRLSAGGLRVGVVGLVGFIPTAALG